MVDDPAGRRPFALPGARPHYSPDRPGQVEHLSLDLRLDLAQGRLTGVCEIRVRPVREGLTSLTVDGVGLEIHGVQVDGVAQDFSSDGEQIRVTLATPTTAGRPLTLAIAYGVERPQRGLYFIQPTPDQPDKPTQAWTQGEDEDSRYWFPCFDYPGQLATTEVRVAVPQGYRAVANGELLSQETQGEWEVFHWRQNQVHPSYLVALAVGDFAVVEDTWRGRPVTYYADQALAERLARSLGKTPRMMDLFSERFGTAYPYPGYGQVCVADFIFGGMENTSLTLLTDRCLLDERAALDHFWTENLVAHELAHQWFGDLVVIKHWAHAWLKEGMATYSEVLWNEAEYGPEAAAYYRLGQMRSYLEEDSSRYRRPMVTHIYREAIELYDRHIYEKGACVYHMLRQTLGEDLFWVSIRAFVQTHAHQTVETSDLVRALEVTTGRNLQPLLDQYVFRGGHPDFKVSYTWEATTQTAQVTVQQTQGSAEEELFDLTLPLSFGLGLDEAGRPQMQTVRVRSHQRQQVFYIPLPQKPLFFAFDAGHHTLKPWNWRWLNPT